MPSDSSREPVKITTGIDDASAINVFTVSIPLLSGKEAERLLAQLVHDTDRGQNRQRARQE